MKKMMECMKSSKLSIIVALALFVVLSMSEAAAADKKAVPNIVVAIMTTGTQKDDLDLVTDKINAITREKIGATVKLLNIEPASYKQQMQLMLLSGEQVDLMLSGTIPDYFDLINQVNQGLLMPLDDLLKTDGRGIIANVPSEYIDSGKFGGKVFYIPRFSEMAKSRVWTFRTDLVDKYHFDLKSVKKLEDIEPFLKAVKKNEKGMYGFCSKAGLDLALQYSPCDRLGDVYSGVLMNFGQDNIKVVNLFETPEYRSLCKLAEKWYNAGYTYPDIAMQTDEPVTMLSAGTAASYYNDGKPGVDEQDSKAAGTKVVSVNIQPPSISTQTVNNFAWTIPSATKYPREAMAFLNLMYADKEVHNLLCWGIEGKHYVFTSDGHVTYPNGINGKNTGYYLASNFIFGNSYLTYVWEGTPIDIWEQTAKFRKSGVVSRALGFVFNPKPVQSEYAAVANVFNRYTKAIGNGTVNIDAELPKFQQKLKDAGIDKVIAEKQAQLTKWYNANHN